MGLGGVGMTELRDFVGNPDLYAVQQSDGSYRPVREPLTDSILRQHRVGTITVGTYTNVFDKARFIVFDDDTGDRGMADRLREECERRGLEAAVELSGRKGHHVWVLFDRLLPAEDLRRLAKDIAKAVRFEGEVFPKQSVVRDAGNLVKLPLGKHQVSGKRSRLIYGLPVVNDTTRFITEFDKLPPEEKTPSLKLGSSQFPCLESIQTDLPQEGERNVLLFHFAAHMRRAGLLDDATRAAMEAVVSEHDLDPGEFEDILNNSEFSGPICDQLPGSRHCPAELCVKTRRDYKGPRPGSLRNAAKGDFVMVEMGEADPRSRTVTLTHPDITLARAGLKERGGDG